MPSLPPLRKKTQVHSRSMTTSISRSTCKINKREATKLSICNSYCLCASCQAALESEQRVTDSPVHRSKRGKRHSRILLIAQHRLDEAGDYTNGKRTAPLKGLQDAWSLSTPYRSQRANVRDKLPILDRGALTFLQLQLRTRDPELNCQFG